MVKIHVIGSSHAKRIGTKMARISGLGTNISNLGVPGAKFDQMVWPAIQDVQAGDILLVSPFGNELQKYKCKRVGTVWKIQRYHPISKTEYLALIEKLKSKLAEYSDSLCDKYIVTNFYRCLGLPTDQFQHPGWLKLQRSFNKILENIGRDRSFGASTYIIKHQDIVDRERVGRILGKDWKRYADLQYDGIHFRNYSIIARQIVHQIRFYSAL
jgi:hypothetical protein